MLAPVDVERLQCKLFAQVSHNANRVDLQICDRAMLLRTAKASVTLVCAVCATVPCSCSC